MSSVFSLLAAIAGLGLLMVVHESGHYFAARAFGMRVIKFSLGLPPVLWRVQPKGSSTTFQIGAIPFFAYVQIAGMNPLEETESNDKGSYGNASLFGRMATIVAGPLSNYIAASIFFFLAIFITGQQVTTTAVTVIKDQPAAQAGLRDNDRVVEVDGVQIENWEQFRNVVSKHPKMPLQVVVEREGGRVPFTVTPAATGENGEGRVGAMSVQKRVSVPSAEALRLAVIMPPKVVYELVTGLGKWIVGKQKAELGSVTTIVKEGARAARAGVGELLGFLGILSANLAGFNLLPIPALDGGRLLFLGYEAVSRRRPDAMVEAHVHMLGFFMLLALMVVITYGEWFGKH